jgi:SAM-dependent methyltransferase
MNSSYNPEQYWDEVAENISSRKDLKIIAGDDEPYYRYKRKRFLELLRTLDFKNKTVLEIGSGPGGNLAVIQTRGARKVFGVDISSQMVALAKENLEGTGAEIIKINGKELPFEDRTFDVVFTSTVLQHNTNETALRELAKEIARVSAKEVLLFERVESKIKGHESNLGRPVSYYSNLMIEEGFELKKVQSLPIQASYYTCGVIRKVFNSSSRKEGEALSRFSIFLQKALLPLTRILDQIIPSHRDVTLLQFVRK